MSISAAFRQGFTDAMKKAGGWDDFKNFVRSSYDDHPVKTVATGAALSAIPALMVAEYLAKRKSHKRLDKAIENLKRVKGMNAGPHRYNGSDYYIDLPTGNVYGSSDFKKDTKVVDKAVQEAVQDAAIMNATNEFFKATADLSDREHEAYNHILQPYFDDIVYGF